MRQIPTAPLVLGLAGLIPFWGLALEVEHIKPQQEARFEADLWEDRVFSFIADKPKVRVNQVAAHLGFEGVTRLGTGERNRITAILERAGRVREKCRSDNNVYFVERASTASSSMVH